MRAYSSLVGEQEVIVDIDTGKVTGRMSKRALSLVREWFELHKDELYGEVFEPLKEIDRFKAFKVDPELDTIVWNNGADMAPEFLHKKMKVLA